jgi:dipeptidyl-peptidase-3
MYVICYVSYIILDGSISLASYEASPAGLIQSWVDRFPNTDVDNIIEELWNKDKPYFE